MTKFTFYNNPTLALACLPDDSPVLFSLDAAAQLTGVHPEMLLYYSRAGLIDALHGLAEAELFFEESALDEIRRIEHYRRHLGVGRRALPLVCELQRQADRQHIELRFLNEA
jgi:DNA-binding transcriptional MerR regulator